MAKINEDELRSIENQLTASFRNKYLPRFLKVVRDSDERGGYDEVDLDDHDFETEFIEWMHNEF